MDIRGEPVRAIAINFQGHVEKGMVVLDQPLPWPDGTPERVEAIPSLPTDFWQSLSLEELATRLGVGIPENLDEILGGWPDDEVNDGFERAVALWRQQEQEPRRLSARRIGEVWR